MNVDPRDLDTPSADELEALLEAGAGRLVGDWRDDLRARLQRDPRVGPYRVEEAVGRGGSSIVFRASDPRVPRTVALKFLPPELGRDTPDQSRQRFEQEKRVLGALSHEGIVRLLDLGMDDGHRYLVTEWVEGRSLRELLEEGSRRPPTGAELRRRLDLFLQICDAVQHAHRRLVVHRDLSASNILVQDEGRIRVLDFGVSRLLDDAHADEARLGEWSTDPMTLNSASPERRRGAPPSIAMDVWSLGMLLARLVGAPREEQGLRRGTDRDLDAIVRAATETDSTARTAGVEELVDELRRLRQHQPVRARACSWLRRAWLLWRRRRLVGSLVLTSLLSLATAAVVWRVQAAALREEAAARREEAEARREGERIAWRAHADAAFATRMLGEVLAQVGAGEHDEAALQALLGRTERRLDAELEGAPEAEARLRDALARVHLARGHAAAGVAHARRAVELARSTRGLGIRDLVQGLELLADLLDSSDPGEASARRAEAHQLRAQLIP